MSDDDDYTQFSERRRRRMRVTAWIVIFALVLGAGGTTLFTLLLG